MRCITAICPAGPPKLRARDPQPDPESLAEADAVAGISFGVVVSSRQYRSRLRLVGGPVVGLAGRVAAPAIERVVERDAGLELFEIVIIHPRQAERGREQPGRLRSRDRAARYRRRAPWLPAATAAGVARPNSSTITSKVQSSPRWLQNTFFDVEGRGVEALADRDHLGRRDEQKHRVRIDEAPDQPGAGDAVDLRPRAGDPDGAALRVARRQFRCRHQRQLGRLPALEAALERLGFDVERAAARPPCPARASGRAGRRRWPIVRRTPRPSRRRPRG